MIEDKELGSLFIQENQRARRFTFRTKEDGIYVTVPPGTSLKEVKNAIEELRPRLKAAKQKQTKRLIDLNFRIETDLFKLSLISGTNERFLLRTVPGEVQLICPPDVEFSDKELQTWLRKVIEEVLRKRAKALLPARLDQLAQKHGLVYTGVKINSSSGRWGSCSARRSINLSYYLLLLPQHLIDYVLLHELTHTREMNHGERFWALLDRITNKQAQTLREELKKYKTDF